MLCLGSYAEPFLLQTWHQKVSGALFKMSLALGLLALGLLLLKGGSPFPMSGITDLPTCPQPADCNEHTEEE